MKLTVGEPCVPRVKKRITAGVTITRLSNIHKIYSWEIPNEKIMKTISLSFSQPFTLYARPVRENLGERKERRERDGYEQRIHAIARHGSFTFTLVAG